MTQPRGFLSHLPHLFTFKPTLFATFFVTLVLLGGASASARERTSPYRPLVPSEGEVRPTPEADVRPTPEPDPEIDAVNFVSVSDQLTSVDDLFSGGSGQPVAFDSAAALARGTDPSVIKLAEELASFANDLVHSAERFTNEGGMNPILDVSPAGYASVSRFFRAATEFNRREAEQSGEAARIETNGWCHWYLSDAACTCGHWLYPQPTKAVTAKKYTTSNPTATLKSWGYHKTPDFNGETGWTRAQTYYPSRCGKGTYRDNAWPGADNKSVFEQNYAGKTPNGEPNPEFWTSAVWPYPAWPTYVYWWHMTY
jgi:hypothetical protein